MSKKILVKNVIQGDVSIPELNMRIPPNSVYPIEKVSTVEEALEIPSVKLHCMRGRIEVFAHSGSDIPKPQKVKKQEKQDKKEKKPKKKGKTYTKAELDGMKMSKLRKIGKPLGARDTKKSELINEIIKAQREKKNEPMGNEKTGK